MGDWRNDELNAQYLIDSGILFQINKQIMHLFGLALVARQEEGKLLLSVKDFRRKPELAIFDTKTYEAGCLKVRRFMEEFGNRQLERRERKLGWGCQSWYVRGKHGKT